MNPKKMCLAAVAAVSVVALFGVSQVRSFCTVALLCRR